MNEKNKLLKTAFLLFLSFLGVLAILVFYFDDTAYISGNGNYKLWQFKAYLNPMPDYPWKASAEAWEANTLYVPVGSFIIKYFLFFTDVSLLTKMTLVNAVFGSLTLSLFFLLVYRFTSNYLVSVLASIFHFACSNFLVLSTTSEDIVPAYALFVAGVLMLFDYLKERKKSRLFLSSVLFSFSWLLHWTLILGALPAVIVCLLLVQNPWKEKLQNLIRFFSVQVVITFFVSIIMDGKFTRIWFPEKGVHTSYLGVTWDKILTQLLDKPLYTTGGFAYHYSHYVNEMTGNTQVLLIYIANLLFLFWLAIQLWVYLKNRIHLPETKPFTVFLIVVFLIGGSLGFYDRPNMQYELQPLMMVPLAYAFALMNSAHSGIKWSHYLKFTFPVILFILNFIPRLESKGNDTRNLDTVKEIEKAVKTPEKTLFILSGWDEFTIWSPVNLDLDKHYKMLTMVELLEWRFDQTDDQIIAFMDSTIDANLEGDRQVVKGSFMDEGLEKLQLSFSPYQQPERVELIYNYLNDIFLSVEIADTYYGKYYRLTPK